MEHAPVKILVVDIGGTSLKVSLGRMKEPLRIPSSPTLTPSRMVADVKRALPSWAS